MVNEMLKLLFTYLLIGYSLACITVNVKYNTPTNVDVIANNNTVSICNSTIDIKNNVISCGSMSSNITISDGMFKVSTGKHVSKWKQLLNAKGPKGNVVQFGQYNCNKLG
jgi:hypothetical protein